MHATDLLEGSKKLLVYSRKAKTKLTDELELSFLNFSILEYCDGITLPASDYVNMEHTTYVNTQHTCNYVDMQHATLIISHVDIMFLACREQLNKNDISGRRL